MKSQIDAVDMKSTEILLTLLRSLLHDCSKLSGTTTTADFLTISRRVKAEGMSFLTITLGSYATDFERCLELGRIDSSLFRPFGKKKGVIPKLFSGILSQVFDDSGVILDEPSSVSILCIRQICRMCKKIELDCKEERVQLAFNEYIKVDDALRNLNLTENPFLEVFDFVSGHIWSCMLGDLSFQIENQALIPRHGSGATALKCLPNQKYIWSEWHRRLDSFFESSDFCYHSYLAFLEESERLVYLDPDAERPVRVVSVPKTQLAPRIIGIEPVCMQYVQQGILKALVPVLESHPFTKGRLNFTDQSINAKLALLNSKSGRLATIDLKDASDRVHKDVVYRMLRSVPLLRDAIFACRSTKSELFDGRIVHLQKFASMGSALCFPIESMVFFTLLLTAKIVESKLPLKSSSVSSILKDDVFVYGDDILCPVNLVPTVDAIFTSFGLKINTCKSFFTGKFRESCGMDAYDGIDVTPVYLRRLPPTHRSRVRDMASLVSFGNQCVSKGFLETGRMVEHTLKNMGFVIPYVSDTSSLVGHVRPDKALTVHRYNDKLSRPEVRGVTIVARDSIDIIDGNAALMKWFLNKAEKPIKSSFERSVSSGSFAIKSRWSPVHSYGVTDYLPYDNSWSRA